MDLCNTRAAVQFCFKSESIPFGSVAQLDRAQGYEPWTVSGSSNLSGVTNLVYGIDSLYYNKFISHTNKRVYMKPIYALKEYAFEKKILAEEFERAAAMYPIILTANSLKITFSGNMKRCLGYCNAKAGYITLPDGKLSVNRMHDFAIKLSKLYHEKSGINNVIKTFRHELAHMIDGLQQGFMSHNQSWAVICKALGGSMNDQQTEKFGGEKMQIAEDHYKYEYKCSCGKCTLKRAKKISVKVLFGSRCKHCKANVATFKVTQNF